MSTKKIPYAVFCVFGLLVGCKFSSKHSSKDTTVVHFTFTKGNPLPANEWHCYNVESEKICIPSAWKFINQNEYLLLANPTIDKSDAYFVVVKNNELTSGFNPIKYLKELSTAVKKDTFSKFVDQSITKMTYNNKTLYYSIVHSLINHQSFTTCSTVFELDNYLFDISLKTNSSKAELVKEIYKDILFNFYHKNQLVFTINDKINKIEVIDPLKL